MKHTLILLLAAAMLALLCAGAGAEGLGEPLEDFTVQTVDGGTFTLSEALTEHDAVLINLWASWCGPCELEFPYLEQAYEQYGDRVAVIALSVEPGDTPEALADYAEAHGLTFPIGSDSGVGLVNRFVTVGIPTSVAVDRFGNVALVSSGAQDSAEPFALLFDLLLSDDYTETVVLDDFPRPKPSVAPADPARLAEAACAEGQALAFRGPEDAYTWPMLPVEIDGRTALASTNAGRDDSVSAVLLDVDAAEGDVLAFDFKTSLEPIYDELYIAVDGVKVKRFTGEHAWTSWAVPLSAGPHGIELGCLKDGYMGGVSDLVYIDQVRVLSGADAESALAALPSWPSDEAFGLSVEAGDKVALAFDDPDGILLDSFGTDQYWLLPSGTATVRVARTEAMDPETAFVTFGEGAVELPLIELLNDAGDAFTYAVDINADADAGEVYSIVAAFSGSEPEDYGNLTAALLFRDEAQLNAFVDYVNAYGYAIAWRYADEAAPSEPAEADITYTVTFLDQNGDPVPGCVVNFCTDETCSPVQADENGVAAFTGAPDAYHLQVIKVPEGYAFDTTQAFQADPQSPTLTLTIPKN